MSLQFLISSIKDLWESFKHKASSMRMDTKPTQISVRQLGKKTRANLRAIPCLLPGILGQGWESLAMTEHDWFLAHHLKEGTDPNKEEEEEDKETVGPKAKAITIPPMPVIEKPGYYAIKESWKVETTILRKREEYSQQLQSFLCKTNIEQAVNFELIDAIPKSLLIDHTDDEGTITEDIKLVLAYMEETNDKITPQRTLATS